MTQMLEAVSIVKSFGAIRVLEDVTVTVRKGEIVGLLGPNGAGKTTLLNIMAGYETQNSGTVSIDGRCIDGLPPEARTKAGLARTFQSGRLFPELSVTENVVLGAIGAGASIKVANRRALDALEMLGLTAVMTQPATGLSHGLSRLVGLARALTSNPEYRITSVRDAMLIIKCARCSTTIIAVPSSWILFSTPKTSWITVGERPKLGSSNIRSLGSATSARAIASCCCCPPLSNPA